MRQALVDITHEKRDESGDACVARGRINRLPLALLILSDLFAAPCGVTDTQRLICRILLNY